jgi:hypothetical protein
MSVKQSKVCDLIVFLMLSVSNSVFVLQGVCFDRLVKMLKSFFAWVVGFLFKGIAC